MPIDDGNMYWDRMEEVPPALDSLEWLPPDSNPFGIRVLDIRPVTLEVSSYTSDQTIVDRFLSTRGSTGEEFAGRHPADAVTIPCFLTYPLVPDLSVGPLFTASVMEEKWDVFIEGLQIRVARSWTGNLRFVGRIHQHAATDRLMIIDQLEAASDGENFDRDQAIRDFDFVMKSYVLGRVVPNTVPASWRSQDAQAIAMYSYSMHGRRAAFATFEQVDVQ